MKKKFTLIEEIENKILKNDLCFSCGLCVSSHNYDEAKMVTNYEKPMPSFSSNVSKDIDQDLFNACPANKLNYYDLYKNFYKKFPDNWPLGITEGLFLGWSNDYKNHKHFSSAGIITEVLIYLLKNKLIDAAILIKQSNKNPTGGEYFFARTETEIRQSSQSVYTAVSNLDSFRDFKVNENYAITTLPEQSAAIRYLQVNKNLKALQIKYILGPYTGTMLSSNFLNSLKLKYKINKFDKIDEFKWRDGNWPGSLLVNYKSGKSISIPKIYYNYLIPFYISKISLNSMDFVNEFADLAVGDAWSPIVEKKSKAKSIVNVRNEELNKILNIMKNKSIISLESINENFALSMHGHMLDFKKRGSYIRMLIKRKFNIKTPNFGIKPNNITFIRIVIELFIIFIFKICSFKLSIKLMESIPEKILGPTFNYLRLSWKFISKPAKRKNLNLIKMVRDE